MQSIAQFLLLFVIGYLLNRNAFNYAEIDSETIDNDTQHRKRI
jgi:hypothetical protein